VRQMRHDTRSGAQVCRNRTTPSAHPHDTRSGAQARAHRPRDLWALRTGRQRATTATIVHTYTPRIEFVFVCRA
jgi:hypothetical protein